MFIIPLNGLAAGKSVLSWKVGKEFFESFENSEILDAQIDVAVEVEKSGRYIGVDCGLDGSVTVECDRCLDDVDMPVDVMVRLSVKYGEEDTSDDTPDGDREIVFVPDTQADLDISQIIYDYVCLALPMQRTHREGECNPEAMKHFGMQEACESDEIDDSPFSALKDMFK